MRQQKHISNQMVAAPAPFDHSSLTGSISTVARLMKNPKGASIEDMMRKTGHASNECRTIIRTIIDLGGEIELRCDNPNQTQKYCLHN